MNLFAKLVLVVGLLGSFHFADAKLKLNQKQYTCSQLKTILSDKGSIWVRGLIPWTYNNISEADPVCSGSRSHPRAECRWFDGKVRAKDGRCTLGVRCSCFAPQSDDDDDGGFSPRPNPPQNF